MPHRRVSVLFCLLALPLSTALLSSPVSSDDAQEAADSSSRKRVKEKYRSMLERDPYHDLALAKILQIAAEEDSLDDLVEEFQTLVKESPEDPGYRYILARIYQRGDRLVEAVAELEAVPEENDRVLGLLGEIRTHQGKFDLAAETLEKAASIARSEKSLKRLYRSIGSLHLARKDKVKAAAAFRRIVEIDPGSFYLRQGVAEALAEAGLLEEALVDYRALIELAGDDASKRCGVLREMGRIHERRKEHDAALERYVTAAGLLRRGNWMKADLEGRIIRVHRERGTLDDLEAECRKRLESAPNLVDSHTFLARVLEEKGEAGEAAAALRAATERFPDDLELGRKLIAVLGDLGKTQGQVEEYQRLIAAHPEETDLYVELGRIFAHGEKFSQAKLQWERVIARDVRDASLCLRLAELYGRFDLVEDAIRSYELAIEIAPKEKSHHVALGEYLFSLGRKEEARRRWMQIRGLDPDADLVLAEILLGHEMDGEALEVAQAVREGGRKDTRLFLLLAEIHRALDEMDAAKAAAREAAEIAKTDDSRREAVVTVVSLHEATDTVEALIEAEESRKGTGGPVPALILGEVFTRARQTSRAVDVYRDLLEADPSRVEVVERLADLYFESGDLDGALETYTRCLALRPGKERPIFRKIAEIHLRREDREEAFETWRRMIRTQPDNPAAYKEVAEEYKRLGLLDEAMRHYRQALERSPSDPLEIRLDLAEALSSRRDYEAALTELETALTEAKTQEERGDVRKRIYGLHTSRGTIDQKIEELERALEENPYDVASALMLGDFFIRSYEYGRAIEMLDRVIPFERGNASLLMQKARLLVEMEEYPEAVGVFRKALKVKGNHRETALEELGKAYSEMGERERAAETWASLGDRQHEADLLVEHGMPELALERYAALIGRSPADPSLQIERGRVLRKMGKTEEAAEAYRRALEADPSHRKALEELGAIYMDLKEREKAVECGRRLFGSRKEEVKKKRKKEEGESLYYDSYYGYWYYQGTSAPKQSPLAVARLYFQRHGLLAELGEVLEEEVEQGERNLEARLVLAMLYERELNQPEKALEIYRRMLAREWDPDEFTSVQSSIRSRWGPTSYGRALDPEEEIWQRIREIYARRADLRDARRESLAGQGDRSAEETLELAALYSQSGMQEEANRTLGEGAEVQEDGSRFLAVLASRAAAEDEHEEAVRLYRRLLDRVRANPAGMTEKEEKKLRVRTRNSIPYYIRDNATKAQVDEVIDLVVIDRKRGRKVDMWVPAERAILASIASAAFKMGDREKAKEALDELLAQGDDFLNASYIGDIYFRNEMYDEAEALYLKAKEEAEGREENPVHKWYYRSNTGGVSRYTTRNLGLIYKKRGEFLRAYDFLRMGGHMADAKAASKEGKIADALLDRYRGEREEYRKAMEEAEGEEARRETLEEYLEATVKLAEVLDEEDEDEAVIAVYREAIEISPPEMALPLWGAVASIHEKEMRFDEAIEARRDIIELKKEMNRDIARYREMKGLPLTPQHAAPATSTFRSGRRTYGSRYPRGYVTRFDTREDFYAIADLQIKKGAPKAAVRTLLKYFRENPGQGGSSYEIRRFAEAHELQAEILPLYRHFGMEKSRYPWQRMEYARALESAGEWAEAIEQYESIRSDSSGNPYSYYIEEATRKLDTLYEREGKQEDLLSSLLSDLEENPRNVKKRLRLARILQSMGRNREAAEHLEILLEEAPYLVDVHVVSRKVHLALGDRKAAIADLEKEIELRSGSSERIPLYYVLGNLEEMEGMPEESVEAWKEMISPQDASSYVRLGSFLLGMRMDDLAGEVFRDGIEAGAKHQWSGAEILGDAARLAIRRGDLEEATGLIEQMRELQPQFVYGLFGANNDAASFLRVSLDPDPLIEALRKRAEAKPDDAEGWMLLAAAHRACGRQREGVEILERALEARPHSQEILKTLTDECAAIGDYPKAIAFGERWVAALPADGSSFGSSSSGPVFLGGRYYSQPQGRKGAYRVLAGLHRRAGDIEMAKEYIRKLEEKTQPYSYFQLADAFAENRFHAEAVEAMRTFVEKTPGRQAQHLITLAQFLNEDGRAGEALETLAEALEISTDDWEQRRIFQTMEAIHRDGRNVDDLLDQLRGRLEEDPEDLPILLFLGRTLRERGDLVESETYLSRAAEAHPSRKEPLEELLALYTLKRDRPKAIATIERIIEVVPSEKRNRSSALGDLYIKVGEKEKAIAAWRAGQRDLNSSYAHRRLGDTYAANDLLEEAAEAYREALRLIDRDRRAEDLRSPLGKVLLRLERPVEALETYREAFGDLRQPGSLPQYESIFRYLFRQTAVREVLDRARSLAVEERSPEQAALLGLGQLFGGDLGEAASIFRSSVETDPDDGLAWRGLCLASFRSGDLEGALDAGRGWMALEERREGRVGPLLWWIGDLALRLGRREEAIGAWRRAERFEKFPLYNYENRYYSYRGNRGQSSLASRLSRHRLDGEAIDEIERGLALGQIGSVHALTAAAAIRWRAGEEEEALRLDLEAAIQSGTAGAHLLRMVRDPEERGRVLDEVEGHLRRRPTDGKVRGLLAGLFREMEEPERAIPLYQEAAEADPNDESLRLDLAKWMVSVKRYEDALPILRKLWKEGMRTPRGATGSSSYYSGGTYYTTYNYDQGRWRTSRMEPGKLLLVVYTILGREEEAAAVEEELLRSLAGGRRGFFRDLARVYDSYERYEDAIRMYDRAIDALHEEEEESPVRDRRERQYISGELALLRKVGRAEEAAALAREEIASYREELRERPWDPSLYSSIARDHSVYTKEWEPAIEAIDSAIDAEPFSLDPVREKGWILLRKGDAEAAAGAFRKADALRDLLGDDKGYNLLLGRAVAAHRLGQGAEARTLLEEAEEIRMKSLSDFSDGEFEEEIDAIRSSEG